MYVFYVGSGDLPQIHRLARQVLSPAEPPLWLMVRFSHWIIWGFKRGIDVNMFLSWLQLLLPTGHGDLFCSSLDTTDRDWRKESCCSPRNQVLVNPWQAGGRASVLVEVAVWRLRLDHLRGNVAVWRVLVTWAHALYVGCWSTFEEGS